jgi:hypothetical protein
MENLDIIILTSIVATLFVVFFIAIFREVRSIDLTKPDYSKDNGPRARMIELVGGVFDSHKTSVKDRKVIMKAISRTIADMESDGIYFSPEVLKELEKQREELYCEYSNLPSVKAYETK